MSLRRYAFHSNLKWQMKIAEKILLPLLQALHYIGARVKARRMRDGTYVRKSKIDEAREILQATILSHVPVRMLRAVYVLFLFHCADFISSELKLSIFLVFFIVFTSIYTTRTIVFLQGSTEM